MASSFFLSFLLRLSSDLKSITGREVSCYSISAKNQVNIDITMEWLIKVPPRIADGWGSALIAGSLLGLRSTLTRPKAHKQSPRPRCSHSSLDSAKNACLDRP